MYLVCEVGIGQRTAVLEMNSEIPMIASAATLAEKFIGTTLHFRYPFLQEGSFVTAVSDTTINVRGKNPSRDWSEKEALTWRLKNDTIQKQYIFGEGILALFMFLFFSWVLIYFFTINTLLT